MRGYRRVDSRLAAFAGLVFLMHLAGAARAQAQAVVEGVVLSSEGQPLSDASVVLIDPLSGQSRYGDVTDAEGRFLMAGILQGRYLLAISHVGFARTEYPVQVSPEAPVRLVVNLVAQSVSHREVIVSDHRARRQLSPITFSNLTAEELQSRPDMKDLPATLSSVPSVTYYSENGNGIGYSTLRMRGFDQRRIAVSINGIPQNDPEDFNVFWINFFDIQGAVEDIQVQRGAGTAYYGSTGIGGAINVVARPYRSYRYAEGEVGIGAFGTRRFSAEVNTGLIADRYVGFGRLSRLDSDGYRDWSWTEFWRFFAGVTRYGDRSTLTLQAYGGPQRDGLAFSGIPRGANNDVIESPQGLEIDRRYNASAFTRDTEDFHQPHAELHHELQIADGLQLRQSLFWVKGEGYFDFGATFRSADYLMLPGGIVPEGTRSLPLFISRPDVDVKFRAYLDQWQVGWLPRLSLSSAFGETTIGAEVRLHRSLRWGRIQEATGLPDELVGAEADRRVYQFRGEKTIGSLLASHVLRNRTTLAVQADALLTYRRYRVYEEQFFGTDFTRPYLFLNPRLGVTLFPEQPISVYASLSLAAREPRLKSLYDGEEAGAGFTPRFRQRPDGTFDFDEPLVTEERLIDLEVGSTWRSAGATVTVNGYWMEFFDEIVPSGGLDQFGVPRTGNADRTRHVGIEVEGAVGLGQAIDLQANVTVGRARYRSFREFVTLPDLTVVEVDRAGNPIPGFPTWTGHVGADYRKAGWRFSVLAKYASRQYIDNSRATAADGTYDESLTVDPYVLADLSTAYAFGKDTPLSGLTLGLDVNNVLDDRILLFGNVGPLGSQFFPTATRHMFFRVRYLLR